MVGTRGERVEARLIRSQGWRPVAEVEMYEAVPQQKKQEGHSASDGRDGLYKVRLATDACWRGFGLELRESPVSPRQTTIKSNQSGVIDYLPPHAVTASEETCGAAKSAPCTHPSTYSLFQQHLPQPQRLWMTGISSTSKSLHTCVLCAVQSVSQMMTSGILPAWVITAQSLELSILRAMAVSVQSRQFRRDSIGMQSAHIKPAYWL